MANTVSPGDITNLLLTLIREHDFHGGAEESLTTCTDPKCTEIRGGIDWLSHAVLKD
jgi:hypothetical protein